MPRTHSSQNSLQALLCKFALAPANVHWYARWHAGHRQLAAVLLKQHVQQHWDSAVQHFKPPEVGDNEKAAVRQNIFQHLFNAPRSLHAILSATVAAIADWDFPEAWPQAVELPLQVATAAAETPQVPIAAPCLTCAMRVKPANRRILHLHCAEHSMHCTLSHWHNLPPQTRPASMLQTLQPGQGLMKHRCQASRRLVQAMQRQESALLALRVMTEDMDDAHVAPLLQQLLPALLQGVATGHTSQRAIAPGLSIIHQALQSLTHADSQDRKAIVRAVGGHIEPTVHMLCAVLSKPLPADDPMCALCSQGVAVRIAAHTHTVVLLQSSTLQARAYVPVCTSAPADIVHHCDSGVQGTLVCRECMCHVE